MKTMSAREAKNGFGLMIDTARAAPVLIEKHGRGVVVVMSVEEYERLRAPPAPRRMKDGPGRRRNVTNEALARIKINQLLKDADWR
jgi:prevent-host-death family protein